jgi:hypothetical protein
MVDDCPTVRETLVWLRVVAFTLPAKIAKAKIAKQEIINFLYVFILILKVYL